MKKILFALALGASFCAPALAETINPLQSEELMKKGLNTPGTAWTFYGSGKTSKVMKDPELPGGEFIRVDISRAGSKPWDVGAQYVVSRPIKTGDVVFFAVYLRAPNLKDGETASVPQIGVGQNASPYAPIAVADVHVTNQWGVYYASGKATVGYPRDTARIGMQLAADKQVLDLGPVFALNLGPNYDMSTLPQN